jgi:hypothetical protein
LANGLYGIEFVGIGVFVRWPRGPDQWNGLSPVIRPVSHLLPIRQLIICDFYTIHTKSRHLNVNKNNCHFAKFIFGFAGVASCPTG